MWTQGTGEVLSSSLGGFPYFLPSQFNTDLEFLSICLSLFSSPRVVSDLSLLFNCMPVGIF